MRKKRYINKVIMLLIIAIFMIPLAGCSKKEKPYANRDGTILTYTDIKALDDGYYVVKGDGKIHPLLQKGIKTAHDKTFVWFSKFDNLIPVFDKGDTIIIVRSRPFAEKTEARFLRMRDIGWTIGADFIVNVKKTGQDESMIKTEITLGKERNPYSRVGEYIDVVFDGVDPSKIPLIDINGQPFTPNMLSKGGFLQGLTKSAMYQFRYYIGTKYQVMNIMADTHVFESEQEYVSEKYIEKQSTYFVIPIPEGLEKGFYIVNGFGMLYYNAGEFTAD